MKELCGCSHPTKNEWCRRAARYRVTLVNGATVVVCASHLGQLTCQQKVKECVALSCDNAKTVRFP